MMQLLPQDTIVHALSNNEFFINAIPGAAAALPA